MNNTLLSLIGGGLVLICSSSFAVSKTDMEANWICTTNASTSEVATDIAAENCRDCTKITCEAQN